MGEIQSNHVHCLICGSPKSILDNTHVQEFICQPCVSSFPGDYLLYRLECQRKGLYKREFEILEERFSLGKDWTTSCYASDSEVYNEHSTGE